MATRTASVSPANIPRITSVSGNDLLTVFSSSNQSTRTVTVTQFLSDLDIDQKKAFTTKTVNVSTVFSSADLTSNEIVFCDATNAAININLPSVSGVVGEWLRFKKIDASVNDVTIIPSGSETIDNDVSVVLSGSEYPSVMIVSDGVNWQIFGA